jgi:NADH-quinone oxidoreductase subunit E
VEELDKQLDDILVESRKDKRFLIRILQETQRKLGYIPRDAMLKIAGFLDIPPSCVWGVVTFYNQFRLTPRGKHPVDVCMGTACHLAGGALVLEAMAREMDIKEGDVSADGKFSLERVACVGCCALAPVAVIGDQVYSRMNSQKAEEAIATLKGEEQETARPDGSCAVNPP